jgi:glycerol-3-phosphate dehydrogenase (NAD(P)+)
MTVRSGAETVIAVLGAGAWGTALAEAEARAGRRVRLWARSPVHAEAIRDSGQNARYLPGVALRPSIFVTADLAAAVKDAGIILAVTPAQTIAALAARLASYRGEVPFVICAKGIDRSSGRLLSACAAEHLDDSRIATLSGPSFAEDVARGLPTAVTLAMTDGTCAGEVARALSTPTLRIYSSGDRVGVEIGGALKNVLAIAAGAAIGAGLGASAQAALVTRGFVEIRRIAAAFGARSETVMGLSGLGDLMLTCASAKSRNFAYGLALARGGPLEGLPLAEGVATAPIAAELALMQGIEAPIIAAVDAMLAGRLTVGEAVEALLSRPLRAEDETVHD